MNFRQSLLEEKKKWTRGGTQLYSMLMKVSNLVTEYCIYEEVTLPWFNINFAHYQTPDVGTITKLESPLFIAVDN